jgi:GAF domain-containing protein
MVAEARPANPSSRRTPPGFSSAPRSDLQSTLDTIAQNAVRVCAATDAGVLLRDGDDLVAGSHRGPIDFQAAGVRYPLTRGTVPGRAVLDTRPIQVADVALTEDFLEGRALAERFGVRAAAAVPLLREGVAIGALLIRRGEAGPFSDRQMQLLGTFADQAVIAIENVRLFKELEEKNRALTQAHAHVTESLEQQTATAEILRVIASSPTEYQPVFDTIVRTAGVVCGAVDAMLWTIDGDELVVRAHHGPLAAAIGARQRVLGSVAGYAVRQARVVHVDDLTEADDFPVGRDIARRLGWRTTLSAPLLREGVAIGAILIRRSEVRPFTDKQIALLQTFADQAVIAIENVRLFTELQQKNEALTQAHTQVTESLEQQTATSEILRVISAVHTDAQPVFDTIVQSAGRLCRAASAAVFLTDGRMLYEPANYGGSPERLAAARARYPRLCRSKLEFGLAGLTLGGRGQDRFCRIRAHPFIPTIGNRDDPHARRLDVSPCSSLEFRRRQPGERRPASSTGRPAAIRPSPSASSPGPHLLALARAAVGGLAGQPPHRQACHSPRLAPQGFPALLALEVPAPLSRSPAARFRDPLPDPPHGPRKPNLGPAPDPSRTPVHRL